MNAAGRPVREIVGFSPIVTELATDMVDTRIKRGMTLQAISTASHYSISTLSQATSGQCIPTQGVIEAYAKALGVDPGPWNELRSRAAKEKHDRGQKEQDGGTNGPPPRSGSTSSSSGAGRTAGQRSRAAMSQISLGAIKIPGTRDTDGGDETENKPDGAAVKRVQQLVMEAVEQATAQLHGNPTANMLSLCTVPVDMLELLRETRERNGVTFRECAVQLRAAGIQMSHTSLQRLLQGQELPEAELLHAVLMACGVPREEIRYWLYHRARLELARERQVQRRKAAKVSPGTGLRLMSQAASASRPSVSYKVVNSSLATSSPWMRLPMWLMVAAAVGGLMPLLVRSLI